MKQPPIELQHPPQHPIIVSSPFSASVPTLLSESILQQQVHIFEQHPAAFYAPSYISSAIFYIKPILQQSLQRDPIEEKQLTQHPETFSAPSDTTLPTFSKVPQVHTYENIDPHPMQHL